MRFFGMRVLRNTPGELWSALDEGETVVLTADGKPRGIILPASEADFEQTIEVLRRLRFQLALERGWAAARAGGAEQIPDGEIEKEISGVRRRRARRAS
jgi:antitoxin (DNA-binding transcriptional repressor) of toxin-antitoxin stability system